MFTGFMRIVVVASDCSVMLVAISNALSGHKTDAEVAENQSARMFLDDISISFGLAVDISDKAANLCLVSCFVLHEIFRKSLLRDGIIQDADHFFCGHNETKGMSLVFVE